MSNLKQIMPYLVDHHKINPYTIVNIKVTNLFRMGTHPLFYRLLKKSSGLNQFFYFCFVEPRFRPSTSFVIKPKVKIIGSGGTDILSLEFDSKAKALEYFYILNKEYEEFIKRNI